MIKKQQRSYADVQNKAQVQKAEKERRNRRQSSKTKRTYSEKVDD